MTEIGWDRGGCCYNWKASPSSKCDPGGLRADTDNLTPSGSWCRVVKRSIHRPALLHIRKATTPSQPPLPLETTPPCLPTWDHREWGSGFCTDASTPFSLGHRVCTKWDQVFLVNGSWLWATFWLLYPLHLLWSTSQISSLETAANLEHTDVRSCLRLPLPMHITFCLFVLSFSCLQALLSPKVFKCIWSFLQIFLVFISQNNREPAEISGRD